MRIREATLFLLVLVAACAGLRPGAGGGIVTLVPSFADDVYALGAGAQLVAVSSFTDDRRAAKLPRVADASSVDTEDIVALRPALVVGIPAQARLIQPLRRAGLHVVLLDDDGYQQIFANLKTIGALTGRQKEAAATISRLQRRTAVLQARASRLAYHPRVFVVLQAAPIWTVGNGSYIAKLIGLAGGRNAVEISTPYLQYSGESLILNQPDALISDRVAHLDEALDREPWRSLRAVQTRDVFEAEPDLLERPGPNYNDAIEWIQKRLTPLAISRVNR